MPTHPLGLWLPPKRADEARVDEPQPQSAGTSSWRRFLPRDARFNATELRLVAITAIGTVIANVLTAIFIFAGVAAYRSQRNEPISNSLVSAAFLLIAALVLLFITVRMRRLIRAGSNEGATGRIDKFMWLNVQALVWMYAAFVAIAVIVAFFFLVVLFGYIYQQSK